MEEVVVALYPEVEEVGEGPKMVVEVFRSCFCCGRSSLRLIGLRDSGRVRMLSLFSLGSGFEHPRVITIVFECRVGRFSWLRKRR
jgi:hypothetical protein